MICGRKVTYIFRLSFALKIRFDGFILLVELGQVGNEVFDDVGMRERIYARFVLGIGGNAACPHHPRLAFRHRHIPSAIQSGRSLHKQASVLTPSIFIAQLPQIPSLQLLRNVNVGSTSFLILISASSIIGPVFVRSNVYDCIFGFSLGVSGDHR